MPLTFGQRYRKTNLTIGDQICPPKKNEEDHLQRKFNQGRGFILFVQYFFKEDTVKRNALGFSAVFLASLSGLILGDFAISTPSLAKSPHPVIAQKKIRGVAVTGDNNRFQHPIWDLGEPLGSGFFNWVFAHNPGGDAPHLVTEDLPGDTVLAGGVDPVAVALGLAPNNVDPLMINKPLHQTPVTVGIQGRGHGTGVREQVPTALELPSGGGVVRSVPNDPITIERWHQAAGTVTVRCFSDGSARADFHLSGLIPNGVYTLWTIYQIDKNGDGTDDNIAPYPFAGVPNVLIPNDKGRAQVSRTVGYCPLTEAKLKFIDIAFHSDGGVYGGVPDQPFDSFSQPMGTITHTQLQFPFSVGQRLLP